MPERDKVTFKHVSTAINCGDGKRRSLGIFIAVLDRLVNTDMNTVMDMVDLYLKTDDRQSLVNMLNGITGVDVTMSARVEMALDDVYTMMDKWNKSRESHGFECIKPDESMLTIELTEHEPDREQANPMSDKNFINAREHFRNARTSDDPELRAIGLAAQLLCDDDPQKLARFMHVDEHAVWGWIVYNYSIDPSRMNLAIEALNNIFRDIDVLNDFMAEHDDHHIMSLVARDEGSRRLICKFVDRDRIKRTTLVALARGSVVGLPVNVVVRYFADLTARYCEGFIDSEHKDEITWRRHHLVSLVCAYLSADHTRGV